MDNIKINPVHYHLTLKPDLEKFTFSGSVKIEYEASDELENIVLNATDLKITSAQIGDNLMNNVSYDDKAETVTMAFGCPILKKGYLSIDFIGTLNDKMKGFYRSAFKLKDTLVYAATTQFEATDARRCFPCKDEPAAKALFTVTLIYQDSFMIGSERIQRIALSNTPIASEKKTSSGTEVTFEPTPKMSTYLLAFIIGPFDKIEASDGKRPIAVYTTPGKSEQGRFALEVACKSLPYYEDYFNVEYPLKKMDLIAIPDFASGAMENWGLVTYRETCLLVDPENTSTQARQYIALVVAHELAHQWFGNLVTMQWWTHLWLNEGFASFMEYMCVDHIFPEYDMWSQFITDNLAGALDLDSLHNSHPIEVPVKHPNEIDEIFDSISYNKGASVIRMLYNYIGDEAFRKGMNEYLTKFAYKNAVTEDLWESLGKASNKPVGKLMSGWTSQKGYPWLSISSNGTELSLTQQKFTANGELPAEESETKWLIPLNVSTGADSSKVIHLDLFEGKSGSITVPGSGADWVKLNPSSIDFYRTAYPEDMLKKLLPAISDQTLPPMDRLSIQSDYFALCEAGKVKTVELLKLLKAFEHESNYTVWHSIDSCVGRLNTLLANTNYQDKFQAFGRELYSEIYKKISWSPKSGEKDTEALTRALVIGRLVNLGHEEVVAKAKLIFADLKTIPADLRGAVYRAVSIYGDHSEFKKLVEIYRTAELSEEKNRALRALGYTKDASRLKEAIDFALSDEVRNQDKIFVFMPLGVSNPTVAWQLLQEQKDFFREKYETGHLLTRLVKSCTENLASEERALEVSNFFQTNCFPGAERTIQQSIETIRLNANWLSRDSDSIKTFLADV